MQVLKFRFLTLFYGSLVAIENLRILTNSYSNDRTHKLIFSNFYIYLFTHKKPHSDLERIFFTN